MQPYMISHACSNNLQVLQASITWKQCADLPTTLWSGKTTTISRKVYCGGGDAALVAHHYVVYCYDTLQDSWTTLPPLPVYYFGLGEVNGKLVAIGGLKKDGHVPTNETHTYDEQSKKWKRTIPPMPTARYSASVLSLQSALVVAGGIISGHIDTVELYNLATSQWYTTDPLPTACCRLSPIIIGNTCYMLGGYNRSHLNQTLHASANDLFRNAVPANMTTHSIKNESQSAWKALANTPTYQPAAAVLGENIVVIGGRETSTERDYSNKVYMYFPTDNSWIYISDLPSPRSKAVVAVLSSMEILVIGGLHEKSVYKGTLSLIKL